MFHCLPECFAKILSQQIFCGVHLWSWKYFCIESIMLLLFGYQVVQLTLFLAVLFCGFLLALQNILKAFSLKGLEKQKAVSVRMAAGKERL